MFQFIFRRFLVVVPTFIGVTLLAFALIHMIPGDPVLILVGERRLDPVFYQQALHRLGLDMPLWQQYLVYLSKLVRLDLGNSIVTHEPVLREFLTLFPATLELSFCALLFAIVVGLPAGILAAVKRGKPTDHVVMGGALAGYSMPIFWWGLILIMVFSVYLGWTPVSGRISLEFDIPPVTGLMLIDTLLSGDEGAFASAVSHLILPSIVLGTIPLAVIARMTRSSMLEVLREDYVRTARAKGLSPARVVLVHALRNALMPVVTIIGLQVGTLLAGAVLTETIFSWPGMGSYAVDAARGLDFPAIIGVTIVGGVVFLVTNLITDIAYVIANPRVRLN